MRSITLDEKTACELEQLARARATDPTTLAREAIRAHLRTEAQRAMEREIEAFRHLHSELLKSIPGQYAAIYHGELVDHDVDQLALYQRIEATYQGVPVLLRQVLPELEADIVVHSPRLEDV